MGSLILIKLGGSAGTDVDLPIAPLGPFMVVEYSFLTLGNKMSGPTTKVSDKQGMLPWSYVLRFLDMRHYI